MNIKNFTHFQRATSLNCSPMNCGRYESHGNRQTKSVMGENIKIILSRTNCRSSVVKGMNHHYDIEIQDEFEDTKGVIKG